MSWDAASTGIKGATCIVWMRTGVNSLKKLIQMSQGMRLHRSRHFSVTWRIDAL